MTGLVPPTATGDRAPRPPLDGTAATVAGWRPRWRPGHRSGAPPPRPALADGMLKLMLILLAIFVFLHSRSEFAERKVAPILDSLALRFAAATVADELSVAEALAVRGDPVIQLRRRLLGHLPISAAPVALPGALLAFDLDAASLFEGGADAVARERLVLLRRLAVALAAGSAESPTALAVTTAWPAGDLASVSGRFAALEALFADTPGAVERLRLGFGDLPADRWRFVIRRGLPDAP
jgi:hypothetical protein